MDEVTPELDRSVEQFFFEVGFGACFAEALVRNGVAPFELTDAVVERAWEIAPEAHEDGDEFDRYLAAANARPADDVVALLAESRDRMQATLKAMDRYNDKNGTHIVGPSLLQLGKQIAKIDAALNGGGHG